MQTSPLQQSAPDADCVEPPGVIKPALKIGVPEGKWREGIVAVKYDGERGWIPAARESTEALYLASDVHQLLGSLATLLGAAENKLAALQKYHAGPAAQAIEGLRKKLREAPVDLPNKG